MTEKHKGWYSKGGLPHFDSSHVIQFITFRLADSIPQSVFEKLDSTLESATESIRRKFLESELDQCHGECYLGIPKIACIVENTLLHFHNKLYFLNAWVVMPNHVHVLVEIIEGGTLERITHSWKSYTANEANKLLGREGSFWQRQYWDRFIRNEFHFNKVVDYIHMNPVKAGLVDKPEKWKYSSARLYINQEDS